MSTLGKKHALKRFDGEDVDSSEVLVVRMIHFHHSNCGYRNGKLDRRHLGDSVDYFGCLQRGSCVNFLSSVLAFCKW